MRGRAPLCARRPGPSPPRELLGRGAARGARDSEVGTPPARYVSMAGQRTRAHRRRGVVWGGRAGPPRMQRHRPSQLERMRRAHHRVQARALTIMITCFDLRDLALSNLRDTPSLLPPFQVPLFLLGPFSLRRSGSFPQAPGPFPPFLPSPTSESRARVTHTHTHTRTLTHTHTHTVTVTRARANAHSLTHTHARARTHARSTSSLRPGGGPAQTAGRRRLDIMMGWAGLVRASRARPGAGSGWES